MVLEEKDLVLRACRHDSQAFADLYDIYADRIYQYVFYRVGDVAEAHDLSAQVFLQAWEAIGKYRWKGRPFSAWLFRIAHNLVVDYHRTRRETLPLEGKDFDQPLVAETPEARPEHFAESVITANRLLKAVTQLTEEQQQVIILKFLEGYSTREIAQILDKRQGAIRGLQFRALIALREMLESSSALPSSSNNGNADATTNREL